MIICLAQTRPVKGAIAQNRQQHQQLIDRAVGRGADLIVFPELSLTGYEPSLAADLATAPDDRQFDDFQTLSDRHQITVGIGMPTQSDAGVHISLLLFQPRQTRQVYFKQYLHDDEKPYFVHGEQAFFLSENPTKVALAICYELSVPEHAEQSVRNGANLYLASVAKTAEGVAKAAERLADIARTHGLTVLMVNSVGEQDGFRAAGQSAIWNEQGKLLGQLDDTSVGLLMLDTATQEVTAQLL
ncbi:carbon-nitrogen hydrolase family protein [Larkinella sp. VNQ87]|uniref:carbon-nitrogen hydrolase family protein n=1 Tax=Larkinella sp. VNQ87 TaxID=3400921 RepID=UPI003C05CA13